MPVARASRRRERMPGSFRPARRAPLGRWSQYGALMTPPLNRCIRRFRSAARAVGGTLVPTKGRSWPSRYQQEATFPPARTAVRTAATRSRWVRSRAFRRVRLAAAASGRRCAGAIARAIPTPTAKRAGLRSYAPRPAGAPVYLGRRVLLVEVEASEPAHRAMPIHRPKGDPESLDRA